mmetsp:Transcript_27347/g.89705  ORF Transcript_27347/g.89705 Transcript_27347/m.89705 type:complete len:503 (+) Transcript_27347:247-1755(+)
MPPTPTPEPTSSTRSPSPMARPPSPSQSQRATPESHTRPQMPADSASRRGSGLVAQPGGGSNRKPCTLSWRGDPSLRRLGLSASRSAMSAAGSSAASPPPPTLPPPALPPSAPPPALRPRSGNGRLSAPRGGIAGGGAARRRVASAAPRRPAPAPAPAEPHAGADPARAPSPTVASTVARSTASAAAHCSAACSGCGRPAAFCPRRAQLQQPELLSLSSRNSSRTSAVARPRCSWSSTPPEAPSPGWVGSDAGAASGGGAGSAAWRSVSRSGPASEERATASSRTRPLAAAAKASASKRPISLVSRTAIVCQQPHRSAHGRGAHRCTRSVCRPSAIEKPAPVTAECAAASAALAATGADDASAAARRSSAAASCDACAGTADSLSTCAASRPASACRPSSPSARARRSRGRQSAGRAVRDSAASCAAAAAAPPGSGAGAPPAPPIAARRFSSLICWTDLVCETMDENSESIDAARACASIDDAPTEKPSLSVGPSADMIRAE